MRRSPRERLLLPSRKCTINQWNLNFWGPWTSIRQSGRQIWPKSHKIRGPGWSSMLFYHCVVFSSRLIATCLHNLNLAKLTLASMLHYHCIVGTGAMPTSLDNARFPAVKGTKLSQWLESRKIEELSRSMDSLAQS